MRRDVALNNSTHGNDEESRRSSVPTYQHNGVPSCDGKQVCAGNGSRALSLQLLLDLVDQFKPLERVDVLVRLLLADHGRGVVEQHRPVAALDEAVMEMEAKHQGGVARVGAHRALHLRSDDVLHVRARLGVVLQAQAGRVLRHQRRHGGGQEKAGHGEGEPLHPCGGHSELL
jgi:hypothetical protein